ncbi:NlpC/P60 family protein [Pseudonocardia alni]|uniref:C40 family peptidase n=1 Tax=Pseudonocardia alni TaxID=33907 RepID=UPI0033D1F6BE
MFSTPTLGVASGASTDAVSDVPAPMLVLYRQAALGCPGLDWSVLAAVGKIETDHGRSRLPGVASGENSAGAAGPMQFLAPTFAAVIAAHPPPPGGATPPSRYDPHDAVHTAAAYLCDSGARTTPERPGDLRRALFAYNHSTAYVDQVLAQAARYRAPAAPAPGSGSGAGLAALGYARGQLGLPYLWGGDGPAAGEAGFDCSGLTSAAWASAGISIPRTAHTQYRALPPVPLDQLQAGDLVFFGTPTRVHHVGIATGRGTAMIHAPDRGQTVRIGDSATLPDLLAAARPA